tara:strand:- start:372 stop:953 length:582 start_codon:yes stop_codon:yes gene_type:complete
MKSLRGITATIAILPAMMLAAADIASATSITGQTIQATRNLIQSGFPESTSSTTNVVVGPGLELPDYNGLLDVDLGANTITLTKSTSNVGFGGLPSFSFNGFRFTDINNTIADFVSFSIQSQNNVSNLSAANLSFTADVLSINLGSTNWNSLNGSTATFVFVTADAVPEPAMLALFGLGLAGIGFAHRRRNTA